jgi:hypothetical protein
MNNIEAAPQGVPDSWSEASPTIPPVVDHVLAAAAAIDAGQCAQARLELDAALALLQEAVR